MTNSEDCTTQWICLALLNCILKNGLILHYEETFIQEKSNKGLQHLSPDLFLPLLSFRESSLQLDASKNIGLSPGQCGQPRLRGSLSVPIKWKLYSSGTEGREYSLLLTLQWPMPQCILRAQGPRQKRQSQDDQGSSRSSTQRKWLYLKQSVGKRKLKGHLKINTSS